MRIVDFGDKHRDAWDSFVEDCLLSTIYHTFSWLQIFQETLGYTQKGFILLDDQGKVVGGLPLFEVKGLGVRKLVSMPFRDRGGLLAQEASGRHFLLEEAVRLYKKGKYDLLLIKEDLPLDGLNLNRWGFQESNFWVKTVVDLKEGVASIWNRLENNAQGPVKQAKKLDVRVHCAKDINEMRLFYRIFLKKRKSLGVPCFPEVFFVHLWQHLCVKRKACLFMAYKGNTPLGGILLLLHKNTVIDGYAASCPEYNELRANDLLVWESIDWAGQNGYSLFDFGADSSRQESLLAFKRKWGGVCIPMHHYSLSAENRAPAEMDSSDKKYFLARSIMSRLPLTIFRLVSDRLVGRFG
ncbi:MAG: hypothetical protein COV73_04930 [Candidatus Omnitrophica bacterium CG11_big_fil_rev_8_21_14_0_20_43_6]|nr:MAG: hypothetical protein COV73_04930 [Candidatus Omnitrophica bacterium CG11_big_fil_rev_8_21_14_0_20_43_6]